MTGAKLMRAMLSNSLSNLVNWDCKLLAAVCPQRSESVWFFGCFRLFQLCVEPPTFVDFQLIRSHTGRLDSVRGQQ